MKNLRLTFPAASEERSPRSPPFPVLMWEDGSRGEHILPALSCSLEERANAPKNGNGNDRN